MFEPLEQVHFGDIVEKLKIASPQERVIINNVITIIKIVLTTGATSATPERSFSLARLVKTWLRSSVTQKRTNYLTLTSTNCSLAIGNDFVDNLPNRRNNLRTFSDSLFKLKSVWKYLSLKKSFQKETWQLICIDLHCKSID